MEFEAGRRWMGRIERGADLWEWFAAFGREHDIRVGSICGIGAVEKGAYAIYSQSKKEYDDRYEHRPLEVVSCLGNYSLKDGQPFPHIHVAFSANDGLAIGGHLIPGSRVFLIEYDIRELTGPPLERSDDPDLGLPVWTPGV